MEIYIILGLLQFQRWPLQQGAGRLQHVGQDSDFDGPAADARHLGRP